MTLGTIALAWWRDSRAGIAAGFILLAEWLIKNVLWQFGQYDTLPNVLTSAGIMLLEYAAWYWFRGRLLAVLLLQSVFVVGWHMIQSFADFNPRTYVIVLNRMYAFQILAVWVALLPIWTKAAARE